MGWGDKGDGGPGACVACVDVFLGCWGVVVLVVAGTGAEVEVGGYKSGGGWVGEVGPVEGVVYCCYGDCW